jgi:hypothetical protein
MERVSEEIAAGNIGSQKVGLTPGWRRFYNEEIQDFLPP